MDPRRRQEGRGVSPHQREDRTDSDRTEDLKSPVVPGGFEREPEKVTAGVEPTECETDHP